MAKSDGRTARVARAIVILAESFQAKISEVTIEAYIAGTADLSVQAIEGACAAAIAAMKFFPKVFELRQLAGGTAAIASEDRAIVAWAAVRKAISLIGAYRTVQFDDPIVTATIRKLGGWVRVCDTPAGEKLDTWLQKEFLSLYRTLYGLGVDAVDAAPLPGLTAATLSRDGFDDGGRATLVPVGLPGISENLVRGVIQTTRPVVALPGPVTEFVDSLGLPELEAAPKPEAVTMTKAEAAAELLAWERGRTLKSGESNGKKKAGRD